METKHKPTDEAPDASAGYEKRDANIGSLLQFGFWLAVVIVVTLVVMAWAFNYFSRIAPLGPPAAPSAVANPNSREVPAGPMVQAHPHQDLVDFCQQQEREVNTYGWVDRQAGVVRVPIGRAMDLVLAQGLPTRPASEAPAGSAAPDPPPPTVAGGAEIQGPCAYLAPPSSFEAAARTAGEK
ncbi:MAG: hypothetical protein ACRD5K_05640 [Candidatus Acidiferrales bacterium]